MGFGLSKQPLWGVEICSFLYFCTLFCVICYGTCRSVRSFSDFIKKLSHDDYPCLQGWALSVVYCSLKVFYNSIAKWRYVIHINLYQNEQAVYMLSVSNVVLVILEWFIVCVQRIIQKMRNVKKNCILNHNRNFGLKCRNSVIFPYCSALLCGCLFASVGCCTFSSHN